MSTVALLCRFIKSGNTFPKAGGLLLLAMMLAFTGCERQAALDGKGSQPALLPRPVNVARAELQHLARNILVVGSLAAVDQATLSVKVAGRVETIAVDLGSVVRQGDLIARLEPLDYELHLKQAEALLAQTRARLGLPLEGNDEKVDPAETSTVKQALAVLNESVKNRERLLALSKQGIVSEADVEAENARSEVALNGYHTALEEIRNRQAQLTQRHAEVNIARQQLADTKIVAPFDGVIQDRRAQLGEYLAVGAPVAMLVRIDPLRLRVEVPEKEAPRIRAGQKVRLTLEGDTNVYTGEIKRLSPVINEQNRMLTVEADVRNDGSLRPGSFARAEILTSDQAKAVVVPFKAILTFAGLEKVFIAQAGKAAERRVITGDRGPDWVEIVSGVNAGDQVILEPGSLQTGHPVTVSK
ncbi:MAG: efflux RND transporter periplasmic adaptor subunit [Verrucomicrobia bacterium]|nr:efflux RND transporter periplasmic adaptor subunit [Verrucomicrobiota bacterium]